MSNKDVRERHGHTLEKKSKKKKKKRSKRSQSSSMSSSDDEKVQEYRSNLAIERMQTPTVAHPHSFSSMVPMPAAQLPPTAHAYNYHFVSVAGVR